MVYDAIDAEASADRGSRPREPLPVVRMSGVALLLTLAVGSFSLTILNTGLGALGGAASAALAVVLLGLAGALCWSLLEAGDSNAEALSNAAGRSAEAEGHAGVLVGQAVHPPGGGSGVMDQRDFVDGNPVGLAELDTVGRFVFVNEVLAGWLGREAGELVENGEKLADFTSQKLPGEPHSLVGDVEFRNTGGEAFPAHVSRREIPAEAGGGVRLAVRELMGERELEETLRRAEEGFRRFFDYAPVGIVMVDGGGAVVETNSAFNLMTGQAIEEGAAAFIDLIETSGRERVTARRSRRGAPGSAADRSRGTHRPALCAARRRRGERRGRSRHGPDRLYRRYDGTEKPRDPGRPVAEDAGRGPARRRHRP